MRTSTIALRSALAAMLAIPALLISAPTEAAVPAGANGRILFASNRAGAQLDLYTMTPTGGAVLNLTNNPAEDMYATYSPNAKKIVFTTTRDGNAEIYVMNANGSNQTRLTNDAGEDATPIWTPNGKRIIFTSDRDGDYELYSVNLAGADIQQLTTNSALDAFPSFSPNGKKIMFTSERDGNGEIYLMNPNGGTQVNISTDPGADLLSNWSPNGKRIVFASDRDGDHEIFTMNANGSGVTQLTVNNGLDAYPVWSPNGTKIAFASDRDDPDASSVDVYSMSPNGGGVLRLTDTPEITDVPFDWHPKAAGRSLSIDSNRALVDKGAKVRLSGDLDGEASCVGAQRVELQARPLSGGTFSKVGSTTTDADGDYKFTKKITASKQFRSVAPAKGFCKKTTSTNESVQVRGGAAPVAIHAPHPQPSDQACGLLADSLLGPLTCESNDN